MKRVNFIKSQNGAIAAEAAFVLPIVIIAVFILIYMALIQIQHAVMYMQVQGMAQKICNISTFPGYEKFYEDAYAAENSKNIRLPLFYMPSPDILNLTYKKHDPYRYLGGIYLNKYNSYEREINEIVQKSIYINGGEIKTDIDVKFEGLSSAVAVQIDYSFKLPEFVRVLGLNSNIVITARAVSYANDTAEFIRNTDLAFDMFDYFLQKYHLEDKFNTFYKKIKQISEKLF